MQQKNQLFNYIQQYKSATQGMMSKEQKASYKKD